MAVMNMVMFVAFIHFTAAFAIFEALSSIGSFVSTDGVPTLGVATCGVEIGKISVLSSRFFLGFGSGAIN
jgi:hypothetical protein